MESRVDTVSKWLQPVLYLYGYGLGLLLFAFVAVQRLTIIVEVEGHENLATGSNYIFCHWHNSIPLLFQSSTPCFPRFLRNRPHVWMQHPSWYMKPIHVFLELIGVKKLVLGSSGHDGRKAADDLVEYLKSGYSTVLLPDGPNGPPKVLKRGILHIAHQSHVAIVPLRIVASRFLVIKTWDLKQVPLPFSKVRIHIGQPITVNEHTFDHAEQKLCLDLG
jgi:lysophospholipid acyltransferase (LPLAT)-like uncharacterized protein